MRVKVSLKSCDYAQAGNADRPSSPRDGHAVVENLRGLLVLVSAAPASTRLKSDRVHRAVDKGLANNLGNLDRSDGRAQVREMVGCK